MLSKGPGFSFFILIIGLFFLFSAPLRARIVIFPFEDLSKGVNGVNFEVPSKIARALKERGVEVVTPKEVLPFLAQNRIRWIGWVDRITAIKASRAYEANLIMVGTVTELKKDDPALGVTVRLIRPKDYRVIWARTAVYSGKEEVSVLALNQLDFAAIEKQTVTALLKALPAEVQKGGYEPPVVEIADIFLKPRRVKGKHTLECAVRLDISGPYPDEVFFVTAGQKIPAHRKNSMFVARWLAPAEEGRYPISLLLKWSAYPLQKKIFLSTYFVDNQPPNIGLRLVQGQEINGEIAFNRYIYVVPILYKSEPIARWTFEVLNKNKQVVLKEEQPGALPSKFVWRGTNTGGHFLPSGKYFIRLKVWDLAGNVTEKGKEVLFVRQPPLASLIAQKDDQNKLHIKIKIGKHLLPIESWRLEFWDAAGNLLAEYTSTSPDFKGITLSQKKGPIYYTLEVRDILGNRSFIRYQPLRTIVMQASSEAKPVVKKESKWVEDF